MTWFFYNILFAIGYLLMLPHFLLRMRRRGGYARHFLQRFGVYREDIRDALSEGERTWVHAVSVGELFVALKFLKSVREKDPDARFVLSVTTSTAFNIAVRELPREDVLIYFPVDLPVVMRKVLKLIRPKAVVLVEGEIWPNLIRLAHRRGVKVMVINGRLSAKSHRGYRKMRFFTRRLFPMVDGFYVQDHADRERLMDLGAPQANVKVLGSGKYDVAEPEPEKEAKARKVLAAAGIADDELVLLGGSTWPGEEKILAEVFQKLLKREVRCTLVLVPRHFERTPFVLAELEGMGLKVRLRSELKEDAPPLDINDPFVLLVNTTGELKAFYSCADIIFVGKSLTEHGGQNVIEPALYGKPILVGPNMENFPAVMKAFLENKALLQVQSAAILENEIFELATSKERRKELCDASAKLVRDRQGSLARTAEYYMEHVTGGV